ncbi:UNVERIFIED_CONTAM: hypothetical protein Sradi_4133900 [Sesamum radiatum]|uniref:Uncharacterized protein n=1 Tax=Sesamum radiatum TaxID=300843 RepID=A0AAW2P175_SESRA
MEVFEKVYKKKDEGQWSGSRAEEVAEKENNNEKQAPSSQASVIPFGQQLWMLAAGGRKRGRVLGLGSEAHHTIAEPLQRSSPTAPTLSPPQP